VGHGFGIMKCNIKYVVEDTDRHGNVRVYFRKRGCRKIRLPSEIGSPQFWAAYNDAVNNKLPVTRAEPRSVREKAGSMRALVVAYYTGAEFKALDSRTQNVRRRALDRFCEKHGHLPGNHPLYARRMVMVEIVESRQVLLIHKNH
jgi:hypothetical protein